MFFWPTRYFKRRLLNNFNKKIYEKSIQVEKKKNAMKNSLGEQIYTVKYSSAGQNN